MTASHGGDQPEPAANLEAIDWASARPGDLPEIRRVLRRRDAAAEDGGADAEVVTVADGLPAPVRLKVIRPQGRRGPHPCLYWAHGGGYFSGSAFDEDLRVARWSNETGLLVVSVDYRLAPEHPFPAAFDDCLAGLEFVVEHARELDIDPARVGIGGGSAGGGLAAAVALGARDRGSPHLAFQLLLYPMLDDRESVWAQRNDAPFWPPAANRLAWEAYLGSTTDGPLVSAYAAPARVEEFTGLPPAYICVGTCDIFVHESIDYAQRLITSGIPVDLNVISGAPHGFHLLEPESAATRASLGDIDRFLVRMARL